METERNSLTFREKKWSLHVSNFTNQMCKLLKKKVQTGWSRQTTHSIILILLSALSMFKSRAVILMAEWALRAAWRSAKPMMQGGVAGGVATGGGYTKVLSAKKPHMGWIHSSAHGPVPQVAPSGPSSPQSSTGRLLRVYWGSLVSTAPNHVPCSLSHSPTHQQLLDYTQPNLMDKEKQNPRNK